MNLDGTLLPEVFAAQVVFWILLPLVLLAPIRWAVVAWLVMSNLDATGPGQSVIVGAGWINGAKSLLLPLYLIWRLRGVPGTVHTVAPARFWLALTAYAAVASLWAPFPLAAAKLVGNMAGILIAIVALERAARKGVLGTTSILVLLISSLALAVFQTYYYGGASYGFDGYDQPTRFSSFIAAQQFAGFLVVFLTLVVWRTDFPIWLRVSFGAAVLVALTLNGSRVWFFGAGVVITSHLALTFRRASVLATLGLLFAITSGLLYANFRPLDNQLFDDSSNRILATLKALATGVDSSNRVGLRDLTFRTAIYNGVIDDLSTSSVSTLLFGHGTSSGAESVLRVFPNGYDVDRIDPNRIVHNEWLRATYEWGFIGLLLLISVVLTLVAGLLQMRRDRRLKNKASAALSFLGAFLLAFSGENVLAGAGNAVTMSLALIFALLWAPAARSQGVTYAH